MRSKPTRFAHAVFALIVFVLGFANPLQIFAQTNKNRLYIIGTVADANAPLPGAVILVQKQNTGVLSDLQGRFSLSVTPSDTIIVTIRYLGFEERRDTLIGVNDATFNLGRVVLRETARVLKTVEIIGGAKAGTDLRAYNMMQTSGQALSVMSSQSILKLPDKNAAEAVRRMGNVAIQNNQGEGAFVSIRGTPSDWTSVLLNGDRLPVADDENDSRAFEFETLPAELIDNIVITRTSTPDQEGDNVGGTINFLTKSVPEKRTFYTSAGLGLNTLATKPTMSFTLLFGDVSKNKKFGYLVNVSYFGRYYGAQGMKITYGNNFNQAINRFELKDFEGLRNTVGTNVAFEYKPTDKIKLGLKGIFNAMTDDEYQRRTMYVYNSNDPAGLWLQNAHGLSLRFMGGGELTLEARVNPRVQINAKVATYWNSFSWGNNPFKQPDGRNGYMTMEFRQDLFYNDNVPITQDGRAYDPNDPNSVLWGPAKLLDIDNPYGSGDNFKNIRPQLSEPIDAKNMYFSHGFSQINRTQEQDPIVAQFDILYRVRNNLNVKIGTKHRWKQGSRFLSLNTWLINNQVTQGQGIYYGRFDLQDFDKRGGYMKPLGNAYNGSFQPFFTNSQMNRVGDFLNAVGDSLRQYPMNKLNQEYKQFVGSNYSYTEIQNSFYAMAEWKPLPNVYIVGGVRLEHTYMVQRSDSLSNKLSYDVPSGTFYYEPKTQYTRLNFLAVLPSLNLTWAPKDNMNLRVALSRTYHRQNFAETKPGFAVINYADFEYTFGNPKLRPAYSFNVDAVYEYYWGEHGFFTVGAYFKYVTDHIFHVLTSDIDSSSGIIIKKFENSNSSWIFGVELNFSRQFNFLPGFASGFGISGNLTYSVSRMRVPGRSAAQAMSEQTPILYNVSLFYEKYGVSARIALNYTGPFLEALNMSAVKGIGLLHKDAGFDIFVGQNYSLDLQVGYEFKDHYNVFFEATNLLDWPSIEYRGSPKRPTRYEYYRQRIQVGFKYTL
jgi:TonB-dependent receptor